jgi:hypothetical protein
MLSNPYAGTAYEPDWNAGLMYGVTGPAYSPEDGPPLVLAPDKLQAFNEGMLVGETAAVEGLDVFPQCLMTDVDADHEDLHLGVWTGEGALLARTLWLKHLMGGVFEGIILLIEIGCSGHHFESPQQVLTDGAEQLIERMGEMGRGPSEFFVGAAQDTASEDCQLAISRLYRTVEQARDAVDAMGRNEWVVAKWRTDQCGGLTIIDSQGVDLQVEQPPEPVNP